MGDSQEKYEQVGWRIWSVYNPQYRTFSLDALTASDINNGYRSEPVYVKVKSET